MKIIDVIRDVVLVTSTALETDFLVLKAVVSVFRLSVLVLDSAIGDYSNVVCDLGNPLLKVKVAFWRS